LRSARRRLLAVGWVGLLVALRPAALGGQTSDFLDRVSLDSLLAVPLSAAAKERQLASQAPASVTVLTGDEIASMGYQSLIEVLAAVRGFSLSDDRNYTYLGVRGLNRPSDYNNRLLVLVDGHRLSEGFYGASAADGTVALDPRLIERVEVVRGPGSALYGSSAMSAVVNIVTKDGAALDGAQGAIRAGSHGTADLSVAWGRHAGPLDVSAWGRYLRSDGETLRFPEFDTSATGGVAQGLDWERSGVGGARVQYRGLTVLALAASRRKGVPTASFETAFGADEWTRDDRAFVEAGLSQDVGTAARLGMRVSWDGYWYRGEYPYEIVSFDATDAHRVEGEARLLWDVRPGHRLTVDAEVQRHYRADYRLWDADEVYVDADFPFSVLILSAQHEFTPAPWIRVVAGLSRSLHSDGPEATTPRAAVLVYPDAATTVKALYGEGFRVPSVYERRYQDPTVDWRVNPDLGPERLRTAELVLERRLSGGLYASASAYANVVHDLIDPVEQGDPTFSRFENVQDVEVLGAELELTARFPGALVRASYARQRAEDRETGQALTNAPAHLLRLTAHTSVGGVLTIAGEGRYDGPRGTLGGGTAPAVAGVDLAARTAPFGGGIRMGVRVTNLFNRANLAPAGLEHLPDVLPQAGRRVTFGVEWSR
jgi:iron complex outermembrane receptor protein